MNNIRVVEMHDLWENVRDKKFISLFLDEVMIIDNKYWVLLHFLYLSIIKKKYETTSSITYQFKV